MRHGWRRTALFLMVLAAGLSGCQPTAHHQTRLRDQADVLPAGHVPSPAPAIAPERAGFAPASLQTAARVDQIGRHLLSANREIGLNPLFRTIASPEPEIFHYRTTEIVVTEGLVHRCKTDGELAAVLSLELGKMVAEREALTASTIRGSEGLPPMDLRSSHDIAGGFGTPDVHRHAELRHYDRQRKKAQQVSLPDPRTLASGYLTRAGFAAADLNAADPLLREAARNNTFERQLLPR